MLRLRIRNNRKIERVRIYRFSLRHEETTAKLALRNKKYYFPSNNFHMVFPAPLPSSFIFSSFFHFFNEPYKIVNLSFGTSHGRVSASFKALFSLNQQRNFLLIINVSWKSRRLFRRDVFPGFFVFLLPVTTNVTASCPFLFGEVKKDQRKIRNTRRRMTTKNNRSSIPYTLSSNLQFIVYVHTVYTIHYVKCSEY